MTGSRDIPEKMYGPGVDYSLITGIFFSSVRGY